MMRRAYSKTLAILQAAILLLSIQNVIIINATKSRVEMVGLIVGDASPESRARIIGLLESMGFPYRFLSEDNITIADAQIYIILGSTSPSIPTTLEETIKGAELIWVGGNPPTEMLHIFGATPGDYDGEVDEIGYNDSTTMFFDETYAAIQTSGAKVEGYLLDQEGNQVSVAELSYLRSDGGSSRLFAYDALDFWNADLENPWLRAYRLHAALISASAAQGMVMLSPYPAGMQSAFIMRIEDVDPLHTSPEWLNRASDFLEYFTRRQAPLTVSLTPTYVDPSINVTVKLEDSSAAALRLWMEEAYARGGAVVQHGYTHQYDGGKTGVATELFDESRGEWLNLTEQVDRIQRGRAQIESTLGIRIAGFEAPHYYANQDTYRALEQLGLGYTTHSTDTLYLDRTNLIVNVPETLGYIPNNPPPDTEQKIMDNLDVVYEVGGVALLFNHLFQFEMSDIGKRTLDYAQSKQAMWVTNTDAVASFYTERNNAYQQMTVELGDSITVTLGPSQKTGLTLNLIGLIPIKSVTVNGKQWASFTDDKIILPPLLDESNTVVIEFSAPGGEITVGLGTILVSMGVSLIVFKKLRKRSEYEAETWV